MCRWLAYSGAPLLLRTALYSPAHGLIDQSLHSRMGAETTNGDGFGVGWYGPAAPGPAIFRSTEPAWNDDNLRELAGHVVSPHFFAHIRASSGTAVQQTNCHPFRHGRWLWMHNGLIDGFAAVKRDLVVDVEAELYPLIQGQTDSEVMFFLALTLGLEDDPPAAIERRARAASRRRAGAMASSIRCRGRSPPRTASACGRSAIRARAARARCTTRPTCRRCGGSIPTPSSSRLFSDDTRLIVSEPLGDLPGVWNEVPEASCAVVDRERIEILPFAPAPPAGSQAA